MTKPSVWLINHYASTPDTGMGGRSFYFARELHRLGHSVTLIAASFNHKLRVSKKLVDPIEEDMSYGFSVARVKVSSYKGSFNKTRILNWFLFVFRLVRNYRNIETKPDIVVCSSPSLIAFLAAWFVAKKYRAKLIFEVRDLWPLTLQKLGGYSRLNPLIIVLELVERFGYRTADLLVSNLPKAIDHIATRGGDPEQFKWIPNGYDPDLYKDECAVPSDVLNTLPKSGFVVGYTGAIGLANAMEYFVMAAVDLKEEDVWFVLVGQGQECDKLKALAKNHNLDRVVFIDPIEKKLIPAMLKQFDACYLGWRNDPLYDFGISPNKLPDYLLSERPILHSFSGKGDMVEIAGAGLTVPAEDSERIARGVLELKNMSQVEREKLGMNGKSFAEANLSFGALARDYQGCFEDLLV